MQRSRRVHFIHFLDSLDDSSLPPVGVEKHMNRITYEYLNSVKFHFACQVRNLFCTIMKTRPKHSVWKRLDNFCCDDVFLACSTHVQFAYRIRQLALLSREWDLSTAEIPVLQAFLGCDKEKVAVKREIHIFKELKNTFNKNLSKILGHFFEAKSTDCDS